MQRLHRLIAPALLLAALSACGGAPVDNDAAARQFLTERNDGTPVAIGGTGPLIGTIESIDGMKLLVDSPLESSVAVQLSEATRVLKQAEVEPSAIVAGARLTAFGTRDGDTLAADMVQLGEDSLMSGGATFTFGGPAASAPGAPAVELAPLASGDQLAGAVAVEPLRGTVKAVDGTTLTVERDDGTQLSVQLGDTTRVFEQAEVESSELEPGMFVAVLGDRTAPTLAAERIEILPQPVRR